MVNVSISLNFYPIAINMNLNYFTVININILDFKEVKMFFNHLFDLKINFNFNFDNVYLSYFIKVKFYLINYYLIYYQNYFLIYLLFYFH